MNECIDWSSGKPVTLECRMSFWAGGFSVCRCRQAAPSLVAKSHLSLLLVIVVGIERPIVAGNLVN